MSDLRRGQVLYVMDDREWRIIMRDKDSRSLVVRQMKGYLEIYISEFWRGNPMPNEEYRRLIPIIFKAKRIEDNREESEYQYR